MAKSPDPDITRAAVEADVAGAPAEEPRSPVPRPARRPLPPPPDRHQIPRLNEIWQLFAADEAPSAGWLSRLRGRLWRKIAPIAQRQQEFNAAVVDHINRQMVHAHEAHDFATAALGYADAQTSLLRRQLAIGVDSVSDEILRRSESAAARERRLTAQLTSLAAAHEQLRLSIASVQQTALSLRHEIGRLAGSPGGAGPAGGKVEADAGPDTFRTRFDSGKYVGFEDSFRGSAEAIAARLADYLPLFEGASDVLDLGCGRGEFLDLLAARGVTGRGVDINPEMVEGCRARGLDVVAGDGLEYLAGRPDASIGGLLAAQVVEHLQPGELLRLLDLAYIKLRPGARIVLETINPACWYAFFAAYIRDITHVRPLHPDTLSYLLVASGFQRVDIRYREPYPERNKLQPLAPPAASAAPDVGDLINTFNDNVDRLNSLLFTYQDYAAVGDRL